MEPYPDDVNGRVLRGMATAGSNMEARYDIDFEHIFPDLGSCEEFARRIARLGQRVETAEYDGRNGVYWEARVIVRMVPTHAEITRVERELAVHRRRLRRMPGRLGHARLTSR